MEEYQQLRRKEDANPKKPMGVSTSKRACIFEKGWTDEEADQECSKNFGEIPENEKAVICDDCYKEFMKNINN
jgi:hypothetical protein